MKFDEGTKTTVAHTTPLHYLLFRRPGLFFGGIGMGVMVRVLHLGTCRKIGSLGFLSVRESSERARYHSLR